MLAHSPIMPLLHAKAPDFTLPDQIGTVHSLAQYTGMYVLIYFYPKDNTPGCTIEACNFRDRLNELKEKNVHVLGISADDEQSHKKFAEKFKLNFPLLADTDKHVIDAYGVWKEKSMFGKKYMGINRESFLIDPKGIIIKHYTEVKPDTHVEEVLKDIEKLS